MDPELPGFGGPSSGKVRLVGAVRLLLGAAATYIVVHYFGDELSKLMDGKFKIKINALDLLIQLAKVLCDALIQLMAMVCFVVPAVVAIAGLLEIFTGRPFGKLKRSWDGMRTGKQGLLSLAIVAAIVAIVAWLLFHT